MKRRRTYTRDFKISVIREVEMGKSQRVVMSIWASEYQSLILRIKELEEIVAELKRDNEEKAGVKLSISSFYERFTPKMVDFLQRCVLHAIEFQAQQPGRVLAIN